MIILHIFIKDQERKRINLSESRNTITKEKPKKISSHSKRKKYEEEIIRILLNYGNEKISYGEDSLSICKFIFDELSSDNIKIEVSPYNKIYSEIEEIISDSWEWFKYYKSLNQT